MTQCQVVQPVNFGGLSRYRRRLFVCRGFDAPVGDSDGDIAVDRMYPACRIVM